MGILPMYCDNIWRNPSQQQDFTRKEFDDKQIRAALVWLSNQTQEHMLIAYYTEDNYLITIEEIAKGNRHSVSFEPNDIFRRCIMLTARGFVTIHNHPYAAATPSRQDITMTQRLIALGAVLKICALDALIVDGQGNCTSLRNTKAIDPWFPERPSAHHGPEIAKAILAFEENLLMQSAEFRNAIQGPAIKLLLALYIRLVPRSLEELGFAARVSRTVTARALKALLGVNLVTNISAVNQPEPNRYQLTGEGIDLVDAILSGQRSGSKY